MKDKLIKALRDIIDDKGADFLLNNAKIACNILCDIVPEAENERKRLRIALTSDTMDMISNIGNAMTDTDQLVNKAIRYLADETFWSEELARETVTILVGALYPDIAISSEAQISAPKPQNSTPVITSSPTMQPMAYEYDDDNYTRTWSLEFEEIENGNSYMITRYSAFGQEKIVVLPYSYNGKPITEIYNNVFQNVEINKIIIPDSITRIDDYAFDSSSIETIRLSQNLLKIGEGAFRRTNLVSVETPETVTYIGQYAFEGCCYMTEAVIHGNIPHIERSTFSGCSQLNKITLPQSLISIKSRAFSDCESLKTINLPDNITEIKYNSFANAGIQKIKLPKSLTYIDYESMRNIGQVVFWGRNTHIDYGLIHVEGMEQHYNTYAGAYVKYDGEKHFLSSGVDSFRADSPNYDMTIYCLPGSKAFDFAYSHGVNCRPLPEYKE